MLDENPFSGHMFSFFLILTAFVFCCSCLFAGMLFESVFVFIFLYFSVCGRYQVFTDACF
ncbi:hypothetical protein CFI09_26180 (plasmid) [Escherichia coli]|nr:hypothetical protein CFI09_26180 [Escherichia coli]